MNASTGDETKKSGLGRDFWMYRLGNIASAFGDSCATIALAWWVLDKTGSPAQMSAILAPAMFVRVFLLPICGPFGDRFSRKWLVALGDIWRLIIAITLALFVINDYFSLPIILALFVANSLGTALSSAGASAMLPKLVPKELLGKAIGQTQIVESIAGVAGGVAAGGLVSAVGVHGAFFFDAFSFAISALTVLFIKANTHPSGDLKESAPNKNALATWATDLASGFQFVRKARFLVLLLGLLMIFNLVLAPIGVVA